MGVEPLLVHVDHRLRASSANDASRAETLAEALGLPIETRRLAVPATEQHRGVGIEEAARRERYQILFEIARQRQAVAVATAHHQDDQAETVLLHLLRGGGVHGAAGMAEWARAPLRRANDISPKTGERIGLWRPFLSEPRAEIEAALGRLGLPPIDDPSNDDVTLRRNALRHQVLPSIAEHFPGARAALARFAMLAAEDDCFLESMAEEALLDAVDPGGHLKVSLIEPQPRALQRRMVRRWISRATNLDELSAERTEASLALAGARESGKCIEIGEGWTICRERETLTASRGARGEGEGEP